MLHFKAASYRKRRQRNEKSRGIVSKVPPRRFAEAILSGLIGAAPITFAFAFAVIQGVEICWKFEEKRSTEYPSIEMSERILTIVISHWEKNF
jgi:hypothetical protein